MKEKITIVTHNVRFHSDDVFAVAALKLLLKDKEISIIRTRDEEWFKKGDYVVDVGGIYDSENNRFDHHQIGGAGERDNGISYAGFGLVWEKFGRQICNSDEISSRIDKKLVQCIDAGDNGIDIFKPIFQGVREYTIGNITNLYLPNWKEVNKDIDEEFLKAVEWAQTILEREIEIMRYWIEAEKIIDEHYKKAKDKRLIVFNDEENNFNRMTIVNKLLQYSEPIYAVVYVASAKDWQLVAVNKDSNTYESRKPLPKSWQGLRDKELADVTGVLDAIFCHRNGFMCITKSRDGAVKLGELALDS